MSFFKKDKLRESRSPQQATGYDNERWLFKPEAVQNCSVARNEGSLVESDTVEITIPTDFKAHQKYRVLLSYREKTSINIRMRHELKSVRRA